ncbi:gem (nuclear organelle) associated protein 2 [Thoreauomyces humboldtii]|nr:gem (nuclear organelle) associated protein 2 [Thoreauomyces humboldtii]
MLPAQRATSGRKVIGHDWNQADDDQIKRPALPLDGYEGQDYASDEASSFDPSAPPASGLEYLRMVRAEANATPQFTRYTAPLPTQAASTLPNLRAQYFNSSDDGIAVHAHPCPPSLLPSPDWLASFLDRFERLREQLEEHRARMSTSITDKPVAGGHKAWKAFCYGTKRKADGRDPAGKRVKEDEMQLDGTSEYRVSGNEGTGAEQDPLDDVEPGAEPLLQRVCALTHDETMRLIQHHDRWLANANRITETEGQWLFALLVRLPSLLTTDELSILRDLCRTCRRIRASEPLLQPEDPRVASLNMVIAVVSTTYRQADLKD